MKEQIKKLAIQHINKLGYEGFKMAHLATELGIKKQSLSYHYPTKKDLVIELYSEIVEKEIHYVKAFFNRTNEKNEKELLNQFLLELKERYMEHSQVFFLQVITFMAPYELQNFISANYNRYLHELKTEVLTVFSQIEKSFSTEECTLAYLTILDGLLSKLVYEPNQPYEYILESNFKIFWNGIFK